jgi:hypothetical protein
VLVCVRKALCGYQFSYVSAYEVVAHVEQHAYAPYSLCSRVVNKRYAFPRIPHQAGYFVACSHSLTTVLRDTMLSCMSHNMHSQYNSMVALCFSTTTSRFLGFPVRIIDQPCGICGGIVFCTNLDTMPQNTRPDCSTNCSSRLLATLYYLFAL